MADNLQANIQIDYDASKAVQTGEQVSKKLIQQQTSFNRALAKNKTTIEELKSALQRVGGSGSSLDNLTKGIAANREEWGKIRAAIKLVAEESKKATQDAAAESQKRIDIAKREAEEIAKTKKRKAKVEEQTEGILKRQGGTRKEIDDNRAAHNLELADKRVAAARQIEIEKRITAQLKAELRERERAQRQYEAAMRRSYSVLANFQKQLNAATAASNAAYQRSLMVAGGMTPSGALFNQVNQNLANYNARPNASSWQNSMNNAIAQSNQRYLVNNAIGNAPPPVFGGGAGGGGFKNILGMLGFGGGGGAMGSILRNALGGLGIGAGMYGVVNAAQQTAEAVALANAYDRMEVAARNLAGSQEQLNSLLEAYQEAAGGAVDKATALESVVRLQATGFARNASEVSRFVRGARGASVALGKPQDYITQEVQLAISNTSVKRLDQIGLGIQEVDDRVNKLKESNKNLSTEMAFQEAVISLLNEKYGSLADTTEGQVQGLERLGTTWKDLRLTIGQAAQESVNEGANWLSQWVKYFDEIVKHGQEAEKKLADMSFTTNTPGGFAIPQSWQPNLAPRGPQFRDPVPRWMTSATGHAGPPGRSFVDGQMEAMLQYSAARADLERQTNLQLLEEHRSYTEQYRRVTQDYQESVLREEEDFNRSRERQAAQNARQVAEVHEDAARREERAARDLAENLAKLQENHTKQVFLWERDLNRNLESQRVEHGERVRELEEDHSIRIEEARQDSLDRLAEMQIDYDERIAEAREDSTKRLAKLEEDYKKSQEDALKDHNRTMSEAAAALDARAMFFEERRYKDEQEKAQKAHEEAIAEEQKRLAEFEAEANEDHQKAITKEKERQAEFEEEANAAHARQLEREAAQFARREEQERAAHQQRVQDALEALEEQRQDMIEADAKRREDAAQADADRLEDIQEAIGLQQAAEDEDRRIRLERMELDHNKQLAEMTRQHNLRITQIGEHAEAERKRLDEEFATTLDALGVYIEGYALQYENLKNKAIEQFDAFMIHIVEELEKQRKPNGSVTPNTNAGLIAQKEAERNELVRERSGLMPGRPDFQSEWNRLTALINALNEEINRLKSEGTPGTAGAAAALATVGSSGGVAAPNGMGISMNSIMVAAGAIQITALPGQSTAALGEEFERRLLNVIHRVARSQ